MLNVEVKTKVELLQYSTFNIYNSLLLMPQHLLYRRRLQ